MNRLRTVMIAVGVIGIVMLTFTILRAQSGAAPSAQVSYQTTIIGGQEVGEVLVDGSTVLRLHDTTGGLTPGQRAAIVAGRLQSSLANGYTWNDVRVGMMNGEQVLTMGNNMLVTVSAGEAAFAGSTPRMLALVWQNNVQSALNGAPVVATTPPVTTGTPTTTTVAGSTESWPDWTNPSTRIVPIVGVGTPGVTIGFAQVSGPSAQVSQVRAVLQLDLQFQNFVRIYAYVPSSSLTGLSRVQGTAVSALLQYPIFRF